MFYHQSLVTRCRRSFSEMSWTTTRIKSLLEYSLVLWKDRCEPFYRADEAERRKIRREKTIGKVETSFAKKDKIVRNFNYLFREDQEIVCNQSIQYLLKWVESFRLAKRLTQKWNTMKIKDKR